MLTDVPSYLGFQTLSQLNETVRVCRLRGCLALLLSIRYNDRLFLTQLLLTTNRLSIIEIKSFPNYVPQNFLFKFCHHLLPFAFYLMLHFRVILQNIWIVLMLYLRIRLSNIASEISKEFVNQRPRNIDLIFVLFKKLIVTILLYTGALYMLKLIQAKINDSA